MFDPEQANRRSAESPLLQAIGISKRYGDFLANDAVDLDLYPNEIHALLGENGAGKSTLVKIIYGALQPTAGEIRWKGKPVTIRQPRGRPPPRHRHGVPALLAVRRADA